MFSILF
jgi:hypothetical protein